MSWFSIAVLMALALLALALLVWWGYPLLILGLMVPVLVPFVAADVLAFRRESRLKL